MVLLTARGAVGRGTHRSKPTRGRERAGAALERVIAAERKPHDGGTYPSVAPIVTD